ncbi:MAG: YggT family protein [Alphaproteobacteria bacterium]
MDIILYPLIELIRLIIALYNGALIVYVILHLLMVFKVLETKNKFVSGVYEFLQKLIEPLARHIRKVIPTVGGFDLSILILFMASYYLSLFFQGIAIRYSMSSMMNILS